MPIKYANVIAINSTESPALAILLRLVAAFGKLWIFFSISRLPLLLLDGKSARILPGHTGDVFLLALIAMIRFNAFYNHCFM